jgi:hypothetical protein
MRRKRVAQLWWTLASLVVIVARHCSTCYPTPDTSKGERVQGQY